MGRVVPFSEIDVILKTISDPVGCIVDTQLLIAGIYGPHPFNEEAEFIYEKLAEYGLPIYSTVTTRHEFIDVSRRIKMSEVAADMCLANTKWRLTEASKAELRRIKFRLDERAKSQEAPILTDREIKVLKKLFSPITRSGKDGWIEICKEFFVGKLTSEWHHLSESLNINYIDLQVPEIQSLFHDRMTWGKMCRISESSCLSSSDAMILNALNCSRIDFLVSADFDIAYAAMVGSTDKMVFVPDSLFRNELNTFQKWIERSQP